MSSFVAGKIPVNVRPNRSWATASYPEPASTTPIELVALSHHVESCNVSRGRMFAVQCAAESFHSFISSRLITTLIVIASVIGITALVL